MLIGWFGMRFFSRVINLPMGYLLPAVFFFSILGSYLEGGGTFGVYIMVIFSLFGYFVKKFDFSFVTFLIGFIIGPQMELSIRQSIVVTRGESWTEYPIAIVFAVLTVLVVVQMGWGAIKRVLFTKETEQEKE